MKILSGLICGTVILSGVQWVAPLSAQANSGFAGGASQSATDLASGLATPAGQAIDLSLDDYSPPNTGGPARSGGSGTR